VVSRYAPRLTRWQRVFWAFFLLSPALRLASYRPWADGPFGDYLHAIGFAIAIAVLAWALVRWQTWPGAMLPWIAAAGVLVPGDAVHYRRLMYGPQATLDRVVDEDFSKAEADGKPAASRWLVDGSPGSSVRVENGLLVIDDPLGAAGYLDMRLPPEPTASEFGLTRPLALYQGRYEESMDWDATIQRTGDYFVLFDANSLVVQLTRYGLHVTYRNADTSRSDADLDTALPADGQAHHYRIERTRTYFTLAIDGTRIFAADPGPRWGFLRFGETRPDAAHGGVMRLDNVHYLRRYYAD
jgi:hypothetical protein